MALAGVRLGRHDEELLSVRRQLRVGDFPRPAGQLLRRRIGRRQIGDVEVHPTIALGEEPQARRARHEAHRRRRRPRFVQGPHPGRVLQVLDDAGRARRRPEGGDVAVLVVGRDDDRRGVLAIGRHDRQAPQQRTGPRIDVGTAQRHRALGLAGQIDRDETPDLLRVTDVAAPREQFGVARRGDVGRHVGPVRRRRLVDDQRVGHLALVREHEILDRLPLADREAHDGAVVLARIGAGLAGLVLPHHGEELRFLGLQELLAVGRGRARLGRPGVGELLEGRTGVGRPIEPHAVQPLVADERDRPTVAGPARVALGGGGPGDKRRRPGHRIHDDDIAVDDADRPAPGRIPHAAGRRGETALAIGQAAWLARLRSGRWRGRGLEAGARHFPRGGLVLASWPPLEIQAFGIAGPAQGGRRVADQTGTAHDAVDGELEGVRGGTGRGQGPGRRQGHDGDRPGTRGQANPPRRETAHGAQGPVRNGLVIVAADASRHAALLVAFIRPVCALLAPCLAGASTPTMTNPFPAGPLLYPASYTIWPRTCRRTVGRPGASICSVPATSATSCFLHWAVAGGTTP